MKLNKLKDIRLISSTIPVDQYDGAATPNGEYDPDTTYASGAIVYVDSDEGGTVYISLQDDNCGHDPSADDDSTDWWGDMGSTDRWLMFDKYINTVTEGEITVEVDAGETDVVGLFNITGTEVAITHIVEKELLSGDPDSTESGQTWNVFATADLYYQVIITVSGYSSGTARAVVGGNQGDEISADGTYTQLIQADETGTIPMGVETDGLSGSVSVDSIKKVPLHSVIDLDDSEINDAWDYFFAEEEYKTQLLQYYPLYHEATLRVTITNATGEPAQCGALRVGRSQYLGVTNLDPLIALSDFSYIEQDADTGNISLEPGNFADEGNFKLTIQNDRIAYVRKKVAAVRGMASIYDFNNDGTDEEYLIFYCVAEKLEIIVPGKIRSECAIDFQGFI